MARRYYRSRVRYIKPKKRWASNISKSSFRFGTDISQGQLKGVSVFGASVSFLVSNSVQSANPTPTIIKTGNFKVQGNFSQQHNQNVSDNTYSCTVYIMYVPQGYDLTKTDVLQSLVADHPEWIMAWSLLDTSVTSGSLNKFSCSSRLKRNLNSGDRICAIFLSTLTYVGTSETAPYSQTITLVGDLECHYWTCAN